jgi:hypothetical protein
MATYRRKRITLLTSNPGVSPMRNRVFLQNSVSLAIALLLVMLFGTTATPAHAQSPITATANAELLAESPRRVNFTVEASSSAGDLVEARIYYQPVGSGARISEPLEVSPAPSLSLTHEWNMQNNGIPPGTQVEYFWRLRDSAGNSFDTPTQFLTPLDSRFDWQTIEDEDLAISWYDGGEAWGQEMFNTGQAALAQLEEELGAELTSQVRLVAFGNESDFRGAFPPQQDWIGGQAFPDLGVTVQIIGEGEQGWMETVLFHELSHLVFAQATDGALVNPPSWLDEGLAMYNEPGEGRGSAGTVERAAEDNELLPFSRLQGNFGADGRAVGIAYAQSEMIVTYLLEDCGQDGFKAMIDNLVADMTMDEALTAACGYDSLTLFNTWRATLPNAPEPVEPSDNPGNNSTDPTDSGDPQDDPAPDDNTDATSQEAEETDNQRLRTFIGVIAIVGACMLVVFGTAIVFILFKIMRPQGRGA